MNRNIRISRLLPVLFSFFVMGFVDVVGISTSYVKADFRLSDKLANLLPMMVFLWFAVCSLPTGALMNRIGRRRTVMLSAAVTFAAMLLPLMSYTFPVVLAAFALLGIGNTILQVSLNPLLTNVVNGRMLTSSLTAGQVIKAVSSFCGPFIATFAASVLGSWVWMFPIFAGASLISALWLAFTPIEEEPAMRSAASAAGVFSVLRDRKIRLLFLGIVAVVGVDVGMNTLAPKLLIERCGMPVESAGYGSSVYFLCRVVGAFAGTFLLARISDRAYYLSHVALGCVVLGVLFAVQGDVAILAAVGVTGFAFSSIFAVIYSQALKRIPARANEISGLMITGVFGGAVVPPLMGVMSDAMGSQAGSLVVLMLFALYLLGCGAAIRTDKNEEYV